MKATIVYYSKKGHTANYAREIAMYLWSKGLSVSLCSVSDFDRNKALESDILLTGCWTCGWFFIGQYPHKRWRTFARSITNMFPKEKTLLFTTYKIRTGSLFKHMKRCLMIPDTYSVARLMSRSGRLSDSDRKCLDTFIAQ